MKTIKAILFTLILIFMIGEVKSQTERDVNDAQGLLPGVQAPMFKAIDADSVEFSLAEALETGPVVIIFYRGFWCPVCNEHLETLQDSLKLIQDQGARVIAVSPEKPEYLDKMAEKTGFDPDYKNRASVKEILNALSEKLAVE
ncbi:MAG: redoxin domain-containing protein [Bacteroidota bacterium]|nr:redoxin domain-containing protein [Bacteroidota bacterium]